MSCLTISLTSYLSQAVILHKGTQSREVTHPTLCTENLVKKENKVTAKLKWYGSPVIYSLVLGVHHVDVPCTLCLLWWLDKEVGLTQLDAFMSVSCSSGTCTFNSASIYDNRYIYKFCVQITLPYYYINRSSWLYPGSDASSAIFFLKTFCHVPKQSTTKVGRSIHN